jgi:hypothetical protein
LANFPPIPTDGRPSVDRSPPGRLVDTHTRQI